MPPLMYDNQYDPYQWHTCSIAYSLNSAKQPGHFMLDPSFMSSYFCWITPTTALTQPLYQEANHIHSREKTWDGSLVWIPH